jgi:hypothetical protein
MPISLGTYAGGITVGATETSFVAGAVGSGTATATVQLQVHLGLQNLIDGAQYELKIKRQTTSTATKGTFHYETIAHSQGSSPKYCSPAFIVGHAWDVTMKNTGTATDVLIDYSLDTVT